MANIDWFLLLAYHLKKVSWDKDEITKDSLKVQLHLGFVESQSGVPHQEICPNGCHQQKVYKGQQYPYVSSGLDSP